MGAHASYAFIGDFGCAFLVAGQRPLAANIKPAEHPPPANGGRDLLGVKKRRDGDVGAGGAADPH